MTRTKYQKGLTLIELMCFLIIGSIITLAAIKGLQRLSHAHNLAETERSARLVMTATQRFYEINCASGLQPQPTIALLVSNGFLLRASVADTKFAGTLVPSISWATSSKGSRLIVTGSIPTGINPSAYLKSLAADRVSGQSIIWDESPDLHKRIHSRVILENLKLHGVNSCR